MLKRGSPSTIYEMPNLDQISLPFDISLAGLALYVSTFKNTGVSQGAGRRMLMHEVRCSRARRLSPHSLLPQPPFRSLLPLPSPVPLLPSSPLSFLSTTTSLPQVRDEHAVARRRLHEHRHDGHHRRLNGVVTLPSGFQLAIPGGEMRSAALLFLLRPSLTVVAIPRQVA